MPLTQTTITGVTYKRMNGALASNEEIHVVEVRKANTLMVTSGYEHGLTNASGEIKAADGTSAFKLPRDSQVKLSADIVGMDRHGGEWFVIPDVDTIDIATLISVTSVPSRGLTVRNNDVPLSSLIGDFDFVGFTVEQISPGKARLTNSGGTPHNLLSATHSDSIAAAVVRGDVITGQGATPKWARLAKGALGTYPRSDGTDTVFSAIQPADLPSGQDAAKIGDGSVSNTEFQFLANVTSDIQTQINSQLTEAEANALYSLLAHTHTGVYEPANANIQSHISSTANPHSVTKTQVGLANVDNVQQQPISARLSEVATIGSALQQIRVNAGATALEYFTSTPFDINGLTEETSIAAGDFVAIYDLTASALRKMTRANFVAGLGGGGAQTPWASTIDADGFDLIDGGNLHLRNGKALRTDVNAADTLLIQARDVDGAAYTTFFTLTANNTPTADLSDAVTKAGQYIYRAGGTDMPLTDGGTGASDASGARTNLGLVIGTHVQAWDADLDGLAGLSTTGFVKRTGAGAFSAATLIAGDIPDLSGVYELIDASITRLGSSIDLSGAEATGILAAGRFPALTGDVATVAGALAATIANDAVSYAKIQNVSAASKLLGRGDSGSGDVQELTVGSGLTMTGTTLSASGGGGTPGGSDTQVQFNDGGAFGGDANLFWNKTNNVLNILSTAADQAGLRVVREYTDESNWSGVTFLGNYAGTNDPAIISTKLGTGTQRNLWIGTAGSGSVIFFATGAQSMRINPSGSVDFNFDVLIPDLYVGIDGSGAQHKITLYNNTDTNGVTLRGRPNILEVRNEAVDEYRDVGARDYYFNGSVVRDTSGAGSPEGSITANIGSTYRKTDGGASTTFYVKESGTGNTGWVAYGAAGGGGITALTGDVTASGSGSVAATIANGVVTNAMLAGSIAYSKLSLTGAILNADLAGSIALSKLSITGTPDGTKFLRDDGSWQAAGGGGTPGGNTTEVQFNNAGAFGASSNFFWNDTDKNLALSATPPAADNKSLLRLGSAISGANASGTYLGINTGNTYNGDIVNLQRNGNTIFSVSNIGAVALGASGVSNGVVSLNDNGTGYTLTNTSNGAGLWYWRESGVTGNRIFNLDVANKSAHIGHNTSPSGSHTLEVFDATASSGITTQSIKAGAGQSTNDLLKILDNSDALKWAIDSSYRMFFPTAATASTVGGAGGASALPATPTGYILVNVNGTQKKVPFYDN